MITKRIKRKTFLVAVFTWSCLLTWMVQGSVQANEPIVDADLVFAEKDGFVAVEAEHFFRQSSAETRAFYLTHADETPSVDPDGDESHVAGASGGAYLEILPDTRRTHGDKLIQGTNFSPQPGKMAVLHYKVHFQNPGRYYVWVRAYSTGSEDNGLHVGIDGTWPESGQRLQWCQGKNSWRWDSKQRTEKQHCGEPHKIYLDVPAAGEHTIHFSMREDGFEFDKWLMTTNREFERPSDAGPASQAKQGKLPDPFRLVSVKSSSTSESDGDASQPSLVMNAAMFADGESKNYYVDGGKWLAVHPEKNEHGEAKRTFPYPTGRYNVTLLAVGENDGQSKYSLQIDDQSLGEHTSPLSEKTFEEGKRFNKTWANVLVTEGAIITVRSSIGSKDGAEFSRARWSGVLFTPADDDTRKAAKPVLAKLAKQTQQNQSRRDSSPTKPASKDALQMPRLAHGNGKVTLHGETKQWHKITLDLDGPFAHEKDNQPNPFTDYGMSVSFTHADGTHYLVPGYFAADGNAAETSAESGTVWRAHFAPDRTGEWKYQVQFRQGEQVALDEKVASKALAPYDGITGTIQVADSDKEGRDLRAHGRLQYVGKHYLQFAGTKQYFLKVGADAPETLLAYKDFDNTVAKKNKKAPLKSWAKHVQDWRSGDPTWQNGKGKGLIGAINYLSRKGCNAFSFLTYNAGGDGDNVWPFIDRDDKLHYDCSKLDQWGVVFDHGTARGMYLHFKMQETENDDHNTGQSGSGYVPESLDGGNLGSQRKLYCRELIARFGHNLALNWNLGEENTQSHEQIQAMIDYIADVDSYDHNIVIHTFPGQQDKVYRPLLGSQSRLTGASLQNGNLESTHAHTVKWVQASAEADRPWIVAFDESGSAAHAQCPDLGYNGFDGHDRNGKMAYTQHKVRKETLWGTLMAGGAGNEYYFGYQFDENDIVCEDWRSRDQSWDYCRIAIGFFHDHHIPFWEMVNADQRVGNEDHAPSKFCFAKPEEVLLVYLPSGGTTSLDLSDVKGEYSVQWFNPREGGDLLTGTVKTVRGGDSVQLGEPPMDTDEDWLALVRAIQ